MNKRKYNFDNIPDSIKSNIYMYDNTYILYFNNVLKELINNYNQENEKKLKSQVIKVLINEWNSDEFNSYLFPSVNFDIIIKAMKNDIKKSLSEKNIKLILRSFCHYNRSDGSSTISDNILPYNDYDNNNGYNDEDTIDIIDIQIFNFLKNVIDDTKLEQFLLDFINDNDMSFIDYLLHNKYDNIRQNLIEDENTINIFKNYDLIKQPHLFNHKIKSNYNENNYDIIFNRRKNIAIQLYIIQNGLNDKTIQIRI